MEGDIGKAVAQSAEEKRQVAYKPSEPRSMSVGSELPEKEILNSLQGLSQLHHSLA